MNDNYIDVNIWNQFCMENFPKLTDVKRYPLNRDNFGKWILSHEEGILRDTARIMSNLFQNVSFEEFMTILNKIANELVIISKNKKLILYLPYCDDDVRSYTFVSMLLTYILIQKKCYFFQSNL